MQIQRPLGCSLGIGGYGLIEEAVILPLHSLHYLLLSHRSYFLLLTPRMRIAQTSINIPHPRQIIAVPGHKIIAEGVFVDFIVIIII